MDHYDFLLMLRKYRLFYAVLFVLVCGIGVYILEDYVLEYEGGSTFYLANESLVNPTVFGQTGQEDILQVSLVQERVYQLAYSTEMMVYLISRFDLYNHYNIDTTKEYYFEKAVITITEKISFNKLTTDLSSIVVRDRNNEIAASMANAAVWKLDELNKKYLINKLQGNLNFYESFVKESEKVSREQNQKLAIYMETLISKRNDKSHQSLSEIEFSLYEAVAKIKDVTTQLLKSRSMYNNALTSLQSKNLPSLVIVKRALPDLETKIPFLILFSVMLSIVVLSLTIILMYSFFTYQNDLKIVFGKLPQFPPKN